jgi:hypothetical protein
VQEQRDGHPEDDIGDKGAQADANLYQDGTPGPARALPSTTESLGHRCGIEVPPAADVARSAAGIARCFASVEAISPIGTGIRRDRQRRHRQATSTQTGQDLGRWQQPCSLQATQRGQDDRMRPAPSPSRRTPRPPRARSRPRGGFQTAPAGHDYRLSRLPRGAALPPTRHNLPGRLPRWTAVHSGSDGAGSRPPGAGGQPLTASTLT